LQFKPLGSVSIPILSAPACPNIKLSPSVLPIFIRARSSLIEAIRKGVLLCKIEDYCILKAKIEISKNKETSILIHCKSME
jgi:hypothetical protein